ncbi:helix-turn-helix transcriptional regulator [Cellulomonas pakistanensis]|uniref:AraC family transcriptional regulator n=1 Tax=Cellulomonas pakistanensis TaxID=992287 RepID=A0A919U461_9CELL|nr:helix-turn-helix transcriptional regulator [Cellulomonas pakistanensis]GIG38003.1 AraC family transcriptional regulator [Cellulomonas pakistanensis]
MYAERPSTRLPGAALWSVAAATPGGSVLPDGCMDLVWSGGRLLVAGPDTRAHTSAPVAAGDPVSGLRFPPGAAPVVLGVPADVLRDQRPELADLWGTRAARPWVDAAADGGVAALERRVAASLADRGGPGRDAAVVARLVAAGLGAEEVADRLGVTTRTLHRRARAAFGYGPCTLARVLRLQRVLPLLDAGLPLAEAAHRAGYADQPHLSREVRALAGRSPGALAAERAAR